MGAASIFLTAGKQGFASWLRFLLLGEQPARGRNVGMGSAGKLPALSLNLQLLAVL